MNTKNFWNRVRAGIRGKGLTQKEFAKACKFPFSTFRNWMYKNVNPPLIYANRISKNLGVSLEYLINGQERDNISKTNEKIISLLKEAEMELSKIRHNVS